MFLAFSVFVMPFTYDERDHRSPDEQFAAYFNSLPIQHPERLKYEADQMPWKDTAKFELGEYVEVIGSLKKRGYSYAEIAKWLAEKIGAPGLNRGHVYRTYQQWLASKEKELVEAEARGEVEFVETIPEEEAEKLAAEEDETERKKGHGNKPS